MNPGTWIKMLFKKAGKMSRISLLQTLCDTARKCVRNQVTAKRCTHIVDVPYVQRCEVCHIWAKLKINIAKSHKFDHFQSNFLIAPRVFYQIIQSFTFVTSIPIYKDMPSLTMRDDDLHELEPSVWRSDSVRRSARTLYMTKIMILYIYPWRTEYLL